MHHITLGGNGNISREYKISSANCWTSKDCNLTKLWAIKDYISEFVATTLPQRYIRNEATFQIIPWQQCQQHCGNVEISAFVTRITRFYNVTETTRNRGSSQCSLQHRISYVSHERFHNVALTVYRPSPLCYRNVPIVTNTDVLMLPQRYCCFITHVTLHERCVNKLPYLGLINQSSRMFVAGMFRTVRTCIHCVVVATYLQHGI